MMHMKMIQIDLFKLKKKFKNTKINSKKISRMRIFN